MSAERRKAAQYATAERQERQGKKVVKLHEDPPKRKCPMPSDSEMNQPILDFISAHGREPSTLFVPFVWDWPDAGFAVQGLPPCPERDITSPYLRPGRWIPVRVVHDPDAQPWRLD